MCMVLTLVKLAEWQSISHCFFSFLQFVLANNFVAKTIRAPTTRTMAVCNLLDNVWNYWSTRTNMCQNVILQRQETGFACLTLKKHKFFLQKLGRDKLHQSLLINFSINKDWSLRRKQKKIVRFAVESSLQLHAFYDIQQCKFHHWGTVKASHETHKFTKNTIVSVCPKLLFFWNDG